MVEVISWMFILTWIIVKYRFPSDLCVSVCVCVFVCLSVCVCVCVQCAGTCAQTVRIAGMGWAGLASLQSLGPRGRASTGGPYSISHQRYTPRKPWPQVTHPTPLLHAARHSESIPILYSRHHDKKMRGRDSPGAAGLRSRWVERTNFK